MAAGSCKSELSDGVESFISGNLLLIVILLYLRTVISCSCTCTCCCACGSTFACSFGRFITALVATASLLVIVFIIGIRVVRLITRTVDTVDGGDALGECTVERISNHVLLSTMLITFTRQWLMVMLSLGHPSLRINSTVDRVQLKSLLPTIGLL